MIEAIIEKYGQSEGLTISGNEIIEWPYNQPKPTKAQRKTLVDDYNSLRPVKEAKEKAIDLNNKIEDVFYIQANGRVYDFNVKNMLKFFAEFSMQGNEEVLNWDDNDNESHDHTKVEALNIVNAVKTFLRSLHNAKKADKAACETGDFSLTNLKVIEASQEALKGE